MSLPTGWADVTLNDLGDWGSGGTPKKGVAGYYGGEIPWLKIGDLNDGLVEKSEDHITEKALAESSAKLVAPGTLLVAMYGSIGKLGIAGIRCSTNQAIAHCRVNEQVTSSKFMFWRLLAARGELLSLGQGAGQPNISQTILRAFSVGLPPVNEQRRIVTKLEAIFEQTRATKARLERLPARLDKLKRSILAAAFRGDLTADWRAAHPDVELASALLDRIRAERRARWEAARHAKGKAPGKAEHGDPAPANETNLPGLPVGWAWCRLDEVISSSLYGPRFAAEDYAQQGVPTIRTTDLGRDGRICLKDPPLIADRAANLEEWGLQHGDLLVTRTGATIGKAAVYSSDIGPALPSAYLIRFRPVLPVLGRWLHLFLISPRGQTLLGTGATATAQPNVNARTIGAFMVPLPPLQEQAQVLAAVDAAIALAESVSRRVDGCAEAASRLERAALAKAFRGEIVEQDPADEPVTVLLERVRAAAEHAAKTNVAKPNRAATKSTSRDRRSIGT